MNQRNKDLPASAVHPIQDKFGQVILMTGFTKQEAVALEVFKTFLSSQEITKTNYETAIKKSYEYAEKFCSYLEDISEKECGIIQNV